MRVFLLLLLILVCTLVSSGVAEAVHSIPLKRRHNLAEAVHHGVAEKTQRTYKGKFGDIVIQNYGNVQFYGAAYVGTPEKEFQLVFDTASSNMWVPLDKPGVCSYKHCYNPWESSTTHLDLRAFHIEYGSGPVDGFMVKDKLRLASFTTDQVFAEATDVSGLGTVYTTAGWDGVLGMGWGALAVYNIEPPFSAMAKKDKNLANQFAFYLPKSLNNEGELLLGGYYSYHCKGKPVGARLSSPNQWAVNMTSARIGSTVLSGKVTVIVDSGTSYIGTQKNAFEKIVESTGAKSGKEAYTVDCGKVPFLPKVELEIAGVKWSFAGEDYVINYEDKTCVLGFFPLDGPLHGGEQWILGDLFMRHVYTIFDADEPSLWFAYAQ